VLHKEISMSIDLKISVLMTSFNREKYIAEAIESVLASTYRNFELIIVDDASLDRTVEIASKYRDNDPRVKLFVNETNLGDYNNRNKAASYATGDYIKFVDADDLIYPWGLEIIVKNIRLFPEAGYFLDSIEQDYFSIFPISLFPEEAYRREYFQSSIFSKAPTSSTIKLEVFNRVGGFSGKQHVGDFELWHQLSLKDSVVLLPHGIIWSREHDEQESKANRSNSYIPFKYMLISKDFLNSSEVPLNNIDRELSLKKVHRAIARSVIRSIVFEFNFKRAMLKLKHSELSFFEILYFAFINV
jgi:glycosyltransferase involved in cell wall biosynthesis